MIDNARARERGAAYGFGIGPEEFTASLEGGRLTIRRSGDFGQADCVFRAHTAPPLASAFYGDVPFEHL